MGSVVTGRDHRKEMMEIETSQFITGFKFQNNFAFFSQFLCVKQELIFYYKNLLSSPLGQLLLT